MNDRTARLVAGGLLLGIATIILFGLRFLPVGLPAVAYAFIVIGLFAAVYLIGRSSPDQTI